MDSKDEIIEDLKNEIKILRELLEQERRKVFFLEGGGIGCE